MLLAIPREKHLWDLFLAVRICPSSHNGRKGCEALRKTESTTGSPALLQPLSSGRENSPRLLQTAEMCLFLPMSCGGGGGEAQEGPEAGAEQVLVVGAGREPWV